MLYHHLFTLKKGFFVAEALSELSTLISDLYELEDVESGLSQIGGYAKAPISLPVTSSLLLTSCECVQPTNWEHQWAAFAPGFDGQLAHIPLMNTQLTLSPGPGFGDCSHPTTQLMLAMMQPFLQDKVVLDIGCGSGILSVAAALLGAKKVYGIDIEEDAISHSWQNAHLNQVTDRVSFSSEFDPSWIPEEEVVILMNMIESQQETAWESIPYLHSKKAVILTSGVLSSRGAAYRAFIHQNRGWSLIEQHEIEGWMGFIFLKSI